MQKEVRDQGYVICYKPTESVMSHFPSEVYNKIFRQHCIYSTTFESAFFYKFCVQFAINK